VFAGPSAWIAGCSRHGVNKHRPLREVTEITTIIVILCIEERGAMKIEVRSTPFGFIVNAPPVACAPGGRPFSSGNNCMPHLRNLAPVEPSVLHLIADQEDTLKRQLKLARIC
jgi:hypothetical protein